MTDPGRAIDYNDPEVVAALLGPNHPIRYMPPDEVRAEALRLSTQLLDSYHELKELVARHETTLHKRWIKRSKQQRLKVLLAAWPDMPETHRPDFAAFRIESQQRRKPSETKRRGAFIWPYINQEDLCQQRTLLLLLNARARNPPSSFAAADNEAMHLGIVYKAVIPIFLNGWTMLLNGVEPVPGKYGELVDNDKHPDAFDWSFRGRQFLSGEGLLTLEAQARVLKFLVDCCRQLLADMPQDELLKAPIAPEPVLKDNEANATGFSTLAVLAMEAPYRVPQRIDFDKIESLLGAFKSAAEDHFWSLREDPSYWATHVTEVKEHRQELIPDMNGKPHPTLRPGHDGLFWARVISSVVRGAYRDVEFWTDLHRQAQKLRRMEAELRPTISPASDLPADYMLALVQFQFALKDTVVSQVQDLKMAFAASPPIRRHFVRQPPPDNTSSKMLVMRNTSAKCSDAEGELMWLMSILWDESQLFLFSLGLLMDELDWLLRTKSELQSLLSAYVAERFGNLSILSQCLTQLAMYQPWANEFEHVLAENSKEVEEKCRAVRAGFGDAFMALDDRILRPSLAELGNPSHGKYNYPIDKRRTRENVEILVRSEQNLDAVWAFVDSLVRARVKQPENMAVSSLLSQRLLRRTAPWPEEPVAAAEPAKSTKTGKKRKVGKAAAKVDKSNPPPLVDGESNEPKKDVAPGEELFKPLSAIYYAFTSEPDEKAKRPDVTLAQVKAKVKTRKVAGAVDGETSDGTDGNQQQEDGGPARGEAQAAETTLSLPPTPAQIIHVDPRSLKVFRTLFHNPQAGSGSGSGGGVGGSSSPGEIPWKEFLHAMTSVGFAAEKQYGSAWQFTPTDNCPEIRGQSIQFHEPHPHKKIPYLLARRFGRRLFRAYGWMAGMFALRGKVEG